MNKEILNILENPELLEETKQFDNFSSPVKELSKLIEYNDNKFNIIYVTSETGKYADIKWYHSIKCGISLRVNILQLSDKVTTKSITLTKFDSKILKESMEKTLSNIENELEKLKVDKTQTIRAIQILS